MARNKEKDLLDVKEKLRELLLKPISNLRMELEDEKEELLKNKTDDDTNEYVLENTFFDKISIRPSVTGGKILELGSYYYIPITHITKGTSEYTDEYMLSIANNYHKLLPNFDFDPKQLNFMILPCKVVTYLTNKGSFESINIYGNEDPKANQFLRTMYQYARLLHPHIRTTPCLGGYAPLISSSLNNKDLKTFITTITRFLQSSDVNDGWGCDTHYLPLYDKKHKQYIKIGYFNAMTYVFTFNDEYHLTNVILCSKYSGLPKIRIARFMNINLEIKRMALFIDKLYSKVWREQTRQNNMVNVFLNNNLTDLIEVDVTETLDNNFKEAIKDYFNVLKEIEEEEEEEEEGEDYEY